MAPPIDAVRSPDGALDPHKTVLHKNPLHMPKHKPFKLPKIHKGSHITRNPDGTINPDKTIIDNAPAHAMSWWKPTEVTEIAPDHVVIPIGRPEVNLPPEEEYEELPEGVVIPQQGNPQKEDDYDVIPDDETIVISPEAKKILVGIAVGVVACVAIYYCVPALLIFA